MNCIDDLSALICSTENVTFPPEESSFTLSNGDEHAQHPISTALVRPPMSMSGVVDAIFEVGNRRKALLGRLRLALVSNDDFEALGFARQLCGLSV